jgi:glutamate N-acetyltransferase/amino-acid N-acetyltransferase
MSVTYPAGFTASGLAAGFKASGRLDMGLLLGTPGTVCAGLFTTNRVAAAPVRLSRVRLGAGAPRAVVVNSGQANAATGPAGDSDALTSTAAVSAALQLGVDDILQCSTGVIGEPLHLDLFGDAVPKLVASLGRDGGDAFARSIMTTDKVDKQAIADAQVEGFRVGGCAKGVGMIAPDLATMLAFVTTDATLSAEDLHRMAQEQLGACFNSLTVDDCTSTNDTVLFFASGAARRAPVTPGSPAWQHLSEAVGEVGESLVQQLAGDAEGGQHVLIVEITGADNDHDARVIAKAVANSPLVKTAVFGGDPNPGRVLQAVGAAGVAVDADRLDVWFGDTQVASGGAISRDYFAQGGLADAARSHMLARDVHIRVSVGDGQGKSRALGCDLSYDYVRINGEYTT